MRTWSCYKLASASLFNFFVLRWHPRFETALLIYIHIHTGSNFIFIKKNFILIKNANALKNYITTIYEKNLILVSLWYFVEKLQECMLSLTERLFPHKNYFLFLGFHFFFTDRGIPAHFFTHARILNAEQQRPLPSLFHSLSSYVNYDKDFRRVWREKPEEDRAEKTQIFPAIS